jgi:antitoxin MazE
MEVQIVQIGNSKGIRLSKTLIDKYHIKDKVDLQLEAGQIVIKPILTPRNGWDKAFKAMHENGDDKLLINDMFNDETLEEWS